jgi:hypothetical protein
MRNNRPNVQDRYRSHRSVEPEDDVIIPLYGGDKRAETLESALLEVIHERGDGLPIPLVLGVLRLIEHRLVSEAEADQR